MYLCFSSDDKRSAFPEASLISVDENGFTLKSVYSSRSGDTIFIRVSDFQGTVQSFAQAMQWVKKGPPGKGAADPA